MQDKGHENSTLFLDKTIKDSWTKNTRLSRERHSGFISNKWFSDSVG